MFVDPQSSFADYRFTPRQLAAWCAFILVIGHLTGRASIPAVSIPKIQKERRTMSCNNEHPDYAIPDCECPPHDPPYQMNATCLQEKKDAFCADIDSERNSYFNEARIALAEYQAALAECVPPNNPSCVQAATEAYSAKMARLLETYEEELQEARDTFCPGVQADCCVAPTGGGGTGG